MRPEVHHEINPLELEDLTYALRAENPNWFNQRQAQIPSTTSKGIFPLRLSWKTLKKVLVVTGILSVLPLVLFAIAAIIASII